MNKRRKGFSIERKQAHLGWIFLSPALVVIGFIILYPMIHTLGLSFFSRNLLNPAAGTRFIGIKNFIYLAQNETFWRAFFNGTVLTAVSVIIQLVLGMILALLLDMEFWGRGLIRSVFILPWATPTFVAAFAWIWLLDAQNGIVNMLLVAVGLLESGYPWLQQPETALISVIIAHVWKGLPWVVLVLLSGLQMVSFELQEAARVDGANPWQEFWNVIVPSMKNVILIVVLLRVIWTFNSFDYVFLLTGGGPLDMTMTWPIQVYKIAFDAYSFGRASAVGTVLFLFLVAFTIVYFKVLSREEEL